MKTKIVNKREGSNTKTEAKNESNKKIQILTEKLANHFKVKLSSLIAEKNYKHSQMILDIGFFVRKLENTNFEAESVIPKLEKFLLELLSKMPSDNSKYLTDMSRINQILKTELSSNQNVQSPSNKTLAKSINFQIASNNNYQPVTLINSNSLSNLQKNSETKILSTESAKIIANKPGAHKAINQMSGKVYKNISKTSSKKNLHPISLNLINNNNSNKQETLNNLYTDRNSENIKTVSNFNNTNENLYEKDVMNTANCRSTSENLKEIVISKSQNIPNNLIQKQDKLNNLKDKAMDEWAMIVKYNYIRHLEDEQNNKHKQEEKKRMVKEILENQMKEKDNLKKIKQEEDKKFFQIQSQTIENMEKEHTEKERMKHEKSKMQKEMQEKLIKEVQDYKNEIKIKDKIRDKLILDKIKNDLTTEEEKLNNKKTNEREMYMNIIRENEHKAEMKKKEKETEKLKNKKALEEYTNLIEKQEKERILNLQSKIVKSNNNFDVQNLKAKRQEEIMKEYEEQRFLKEKEELEKKQKFLEESTKIKKLRQIDEIKNSLKTQIEERKRIENEHKKIDLKYNEIVKSNMEKFISDKENKFKINQNKVNSYKDDLDKQMNEKGKKKIYMDEKEKQLNKDLIGKIYSEYIDYE